MDKEKKQRIKNELVRAGQIIKKTLSEVVAIIGDVGKNAEDSLK